MDLYRGLAETVQKSYRAHVELQKQKEQERQTYLDLAHQLRSPIVNAYRRAQLTLERGVQDGDLRSNLMKVRGLCGKARTVTLSVKLFADLAKEDKLTARLTSIQAGDLRQMIIECADDTQTQTSLENTRDLRFDVDKRSDTDRKGFDALINNTVLGDLDLLRQAISNILDNAGKYARSGTTVRITAGLTRSGWFHLTVSNKPFFRPKNPELWRIRGWRGEEAQDVTSEGSGIGLFIVDRVMFAHNGKLEIIPWNNEELTEVKLLFPITRT
jgi:signal transduction histidine kinase